MIKLLKILRIANNNKLKLYSKNKFQFLLLKTKTSRNVNESNKNELVNDSRPKIKLAELLVNKSSLSLQPYLKMMRVHKPIGYWLLFWPCSWGLGAAATSGAVPNLYLLALFGAGSFVMRGAGCTINDMWDRDLDGKVARTSDRPLVNGTMTMGQAWGFLAGQLTVGLLILLQLNWYSVLLGASSLGLVCIYPLAKRVTYWPQLILGLTFNWGVFVGYSAVCNSIHWPICTPLYISAVCWTLIYDTIYAHQDIADDVTIGIKSTAIQFQENTKYWLAGFSTLMIGSLISSGIISDQTWPYYSAVALTTSHLIWQIHTLNIHNPIDCGSKFVSNHYVGLLIFLGIVVGNIYKENKTNFKQISVISLNSE